MITNVSLLTAFVAGMFSISSPCVLPLVPIYLAHMAGITTGDGRAVNRATLMRNAFAYVAGFSLVFVTLGIAVGAAGSLATAVDVVPQNRDWLVRIGGLLLIGLGLYQTGLIRLPWFDRERRFSLSPGTPGSVSSSFVIGVGFGAGWSPCIGPILGAILTLAAGQGSIERAALLLTFYTVGLGVPFLLVAAAFGSIQPVLRRINAHLHTITVVSGAIMLGVGVIMVLGMYEQMFIEIIRNAPWSPWEPTL